MTTPRKQPVAAVTHDWSHMSALELGALFEDRVADPRDVTEVFLAHAEENDPDRRIYVRLTKERARAEAAAAADRAKRGLRRGPLDGVPLSWKDLFDMAGEPTAAGSLPLKDRVPAQDAEVLTRLTRAGLVALGKTTMTELAFSGLGVNPNFGTPANPWDDKVERAPGGSSAGAGVSVASGLAAAAIGTDTGGSVRIPAAWNGLVGLKTTHGRVPLAGTVPLSHTFDTVGPLTRDVADAAALFGLLAGTGTPDLEGHELGRTVLWLPKGVAGDIGWQGLEDGIAAAVDAALHKLVAKGVRIVEHDLPELDEVNALAWSPTESRLVADAYALWGEMLRANEDRIFRPVFERVTAGEALKIADLMRADARREDIRNLYLARTAGVDAVVMPTVAIAPPPIAELEPGGDAYGQANRMALRNTTIGNQLGLCAVTLPVGHDAKGMPVGLMLQAAPGHDEKLLRLARAIEKALN
ncbi:amidase [Parvibaculum sp. MBR-TMA-1.3b-4.2]